MAEVQLGSDVRHAVTNDCLTLILGVPMTGVGVRREKAARSGDAEVAVIHCRTYMGITGSSASPNLVAARLHPRVESRFTALRRDCAYIADKPVPPPPRGFSIASWPSRPLVVRFF